MNMITVPQFYLILLGWLRALSYTAQHDSQYTKSNCHITLVFCMITMLINFSINVIGPLSAYFIENTFRKGEASLKVRQCIFISDFCLQRYLCTLSFNQNFWNNGASKSTEVPAVNMERFKVLTFFDSFLKEMDKKGSN